MTNTRRTRWAALGHLEFALFVLAALQLHALQWANCPVCGAGHSTISPGSPCSAACARKAIQDRQFHGREPDATPDQERAGAHRGSGRGSGGGGQHKKTGNCQFRLLELGAIPAALVALTVHLVRRSRR